MKKLLALLLAMIVVLSMVACGNDADNDDDDDDDDKEKTTQTTKADDTDEGTGTTAPVDTDAVTTPETTPDTTPETNAPAGDTTPAGVNAGTIADGVYTNTWVNLTYTIPAGLSDMTAMAGASMDGVNEMMGLCAVNMQTGSMVQIHVEKLGNDPDYSSAKTAIEDAIAEMKESEGDGVTVNASEATEIEIKGVKYWATDIVITADGETACYSFAVTEKDGYLLIMSFIAADEATMDTLVDGIAL